MHLSHLARSLRRPPSIPVLRSGRRFASSTPKEEINSKSFAKYVLGITDVRVLIVFPLVLGVCVVTAWFDAQKELAKEPPKYKELPGGRIMLQDGSIVSPPKSPR